MNLSSLLDFIAKEHPAFVHVPLGMVVVLPLAMLGTFRLHSSLRWVRTAFFLALMGLFGSVIALFSGVLWGRQIGLIPPGGFLPPAATAAQTLQKMLRLHEFAAVFGVSIGLLCTFLIWRTWRRSAAHGESTAMHHQRQLGRRFWERGVGVPAFLLSILWLGCWGFCGKLGGIMVFGNEETNRAAAEAEAKRKNDVEAELPIRALDYASLEPLTPEPQFSKAHGAFWVRTWVPASGIDAYKAGKPLSPGAYTVLSTFLDQKGKPSHEPGPLYFKEVLADGKVAFALYWPRVPEQKRAEFGGEDSLYWRSPEPRLSTCAACHKDAGPAASPR
jgi:hypothetical protein